MKKTLLSLLCLLGCASPIVAASAADNDPDDNLVKNDAWVVDMKNASIEDTNTLRDIKYVYNPETKVYTFYGIIEGEAKVKFHIANASNTNNIAFDNGVTADEDYDSMWYLPDSKGDNEHLVAVLSHYDYSNTNLKTFNTRYSEDTNSGILVILNGSRSKIKRVLSFGTGKYGEESIEEVADIAAFKAKAQSSKIDLGYNTPAKVYKITGKVTCIVDLNPQNSWYYLQDATGTLAVYSNKSFPLGAAQSYKAGDVLEGITGYSVGSGNDGYYMDVMDEQFYVYDIPDHDATKEYTLFPAASGTAEILAPREVTRKSEVLRSQNHDYVRLKGWKYVAEKSATGNQAPASLVDADGKYFELTWDYVTVDKDGVEEEENIFLNAVADGTVGDYTGFVSNSTKNFTIVSWDIASTIKNIDTNTTSTPKLYNVAGQRISTPHPGLNIINGKKIVY